MIRAPSAESAFHGVDAHAKGGITGIEITFSTPDAPDIIDLLRQRFGDSVLIGAGSIVQPSQAIEAAQAGGLIPRVARRLRVRCEGHHGNGPHTMPRALTPSKVTAANDAGADVIKIFPASLNGPKVIVSLKGPFPGLAFMPTGGVSVANLDQWLATAVAAVGAGGELCSSSDLAEGRYDDIREHAFAFSSRYHAIREGVNR